MKRETREGNNNLMFSTAQALGREGCADPVRPPGPGPGTVMGQPPAPPASPLVALEMGGGWEQEGGWMGSPMGSCSPKRSSTAQSRGCSSAKTRPGGGKTGPGRSEAAPTPLPTPAQSSRFPPPAPLLLPGSGTTSASALLRNHSRKWESGAGKGRSRLALQWLGLLPAPGRALPSREAEQRVACVGVCLGFSARNAAHA